MHYYTQQQLLAAIRLMIDELGRDKPNFLEIAELMDECSSTLAQEIELMRDKISRNKKLSGG